jgi:hypothetical protein
MSKEKEDTPKPAPTAVSTITPSSVSAMMHALQSEINDSKSGAMPESTARIVLKGRALQIELAKLQLQYARLNKGRQPDSELQLIAAKASTPPDSAT